MADELKLNQELNSARKEIKTDSFSMSIGEIINLYRDGDLELNPAYQRLFRWDDPQKSKFIESILLGIPLPPIFVAQKEDGKWSVVDGLQRLSTILQLTGELKNIDRKTKKEVEAPPLVLRTTKKLPSLEGFNWETLPNEIKRMLKRSKFNINIILTENSIQAQYELFQRLNTGGIHLEPQEIRNCLIIMINDLFYEKLEELKEFGAFKNSLSLQEEKFNIEYHMELILRYFISRHNTINFKDYNITNTTLSDFLDNETLRLLEDPAFDLKKETEIFKRTFTLIYSHLRKDSFKKYNYIKKKFEGAFSNSGFEAITTGVSHNIASLEKLSKDEFIEKIKMLYSQEDFLLHSKRGNKVISRIKGMIDFSEIYFKI